MNDSNEVVIVDQIQPLILILRSQRILLDADLARLYGVPTKALNQSVKRHRTRFPDDFMFRLTAEEKTKLFTECDRFSPLRFNKALPHAFAEHGAIMAANILNSPRAIQVGVFVVRAFVRLREFLASTSELARKLDELERTGVSHDDSIRVLVNSMRQLMAPPPDRPRRRIGFHGGPTGRQRNLAVAAGGLTAHWLSTGPHAAVAPPSCICLPVPGASVVVSAMT